MNKQQQELYEKLLKKVNEYCIGAAAEDVIEAIDALVENYEKPKKRISKTKDQLLVENEVYQFMLHTVRYYVEEKEYSLEDFAKRLKALEIIKTKPIVALVDYKYTYEEWLDVVEERDKDLFENKEEYELLKEILK